jgi:hypothetical protein
MQELGKLLAFRVDTGQEGDDDLAYKGGHELLRWADAIDAALAEYGVAKMGYAREGPSEVERLRQELIEWQSECFYQFAHLETSGKHNLWYNAMCRSTLERLGNALVAGGVMERHPDENWYRPVKAKEKP